MRRNFAQILKEAKIDIKSEYQKLYGMLYDLKVATLEGQEQMVSQGPTAAIVPIKQLGTNGGGYFGVNSSHPLENPTYLTNMAECWSILIIPMAMVFALGFYTRRKKLGYSIFGVMLFAYLVGVCINVRQEMGGESAYR